MKMKQQNQPKNMAGMSSLLLRWMRARSVRRRFWVLVVCSCLALILSASAVVFASSYHAAVEQHTSYVANMMSQLENDLRNRLLHMRTDAIDLAYNSALQNYVLASGQEKSSAGRLNVTDEVAHAVTSKFSSTSDESALVMLTLDGHNCYTYSNNNRLDLFFSDSFTEYIIQKIEESSAGYWFYAFPPDYYRLDREARRFEQPSKTDEAVVFYGLKMKRLSDSQCVGYLMMVLRSELLTTLFDHFDWGGLSSIYLVNERGDEIIHGQDMEEGTLDALPGMLGSGLEHTVRVTKRRKALATDYILSMPLAEIGWQVVNVVDGAALARLALSNCRNLVLLTMVMLCILPLLIWVNNRSVTIPLERILTGLEAIRQGDFDTRVGDDGNDEFSQIASSIDQMSQRLHDLIEQVKTTEQQYSEARLELLQMQINPHFITNALNTVSWMAEIRKEEDIARVLTSLSSLLNQTLRSGREFITLADELQYIRWYVDVQQYRGTLQYRLNVDVSDELLSCRLPPFTLEPLVENSITHGTVYRRGSMDITIKAVQTGNVLECMVIDNGSGMDAAVLETVGRSQRKPGSGLYRVHGIGIANVRKRLQLYFGADYGVSYDSVPGQFTIATVRLPASRDMRDWEYDGRGNGGCIM